MLVSRFGFDGTVLPRDPPLDSPGPPRPFPDSSFPRTAPPFPRTAPLFPRTAFPRTASPRTLFCRKIRSFLPSLGVFSLNFGGVLCFRRPGPLNVCVWALGLWCERRFRGRRGFTEVKGVKGGGGGEGGLTPSPGETPEASWLLGPPPQKIFLAKCGRDQIQHWVKPDIFKNIENSPSSTSTGSRLCFLLAFDQHAESLEINRNEHFSNFTSFVVVQIGDQFDNVMRNSDPVTINCLFVDMILTSIHPYLLYKQVAISNIRPIWVIHRIQHFRSDSFVSWQRARQASISE